MVRCTNWMYLVNVDWLGGLPVNKGKNEKNPKDTIHTFQCHTAPPRALGSATGTMCLLICTFCERPTNFDAYPCTPPQDEPQDDIFTFSPTSRILRYSFRPKCRPNSRCKVPCSKRTSDQDFRHYSPGHMLFPDELQSEMSYRMLPVFTEFSGS